MLQYVRSRLIPYLRTQILPSKPAQLLIQTWLKWDSDDVPGMAAALSYYALFPLLLVVLSIIGAVMGPNTEVFEAIQDVIVRYLPPEVHDLIKDTILALNENSVGAGLVGTVILLFAASTIFAILKRSVNKIWESPSRVSEAGSPAKMALLLAGLQWLVSSSVISLGSRFVSYGVIGSVMVLMLWIFLACQIFFAGCEFSFVYAHIFGTKRRAARFGE